jgi:hypothetical protein
MSFRHAPALVILLAACAGSASSAATSELGDSTLGSAPQCELPADCVIASRTCCGEGGAATERDSVALPRAWRDDGRIACEGASMSCPDCFQETDPSLIATCQANECRVVALTREPVTACNTDVDCVLRPAQCCESGASSFLAVRSDSVDQLDRLLCGEEPVACPECIGRPPEGLLARCTEGRCVASR